MNIVWSDARKKLVIGLLRRGKEYSEIAVALESTVETIKALIQRMRKTSTRVLASGEPFDPDLVPPASARVNTAVLRRKIKTKEKPVKPHQFSGRLTAGLVSAYDPELPRPAFKDRPVCADELQTAVTVLEVTAAQCHWPFGDPSTREFRFCGAQKEDQTTPYCERHNRRARSRDQGDTES